MTLDDIFEEIKKAQKRRLQIICKRHILRNTLLHLKRSYC